MVSAELAHYARDGSSLRLLPRCEVQAVIPASAGQHDPKLERAGPLRAISTAGLGYGHTATPYPSRWSLTRVEQNASGRFSRVTKRFSARIAERRTEWSGRTDTVR